MFNIGYQNHWKIYWRLQSDKAGPLLELAERALKTLLNGVLTMINLSIKWVVELMSQPETGMGYQIVSILLKDGRKFDQAVVVEGQITEIRGRDDIPFTEEQIIQIILTHDKWDFNAER